MTDKPTDKPAYLKTRKVNKNSDALSPEEKELMKKACHGFSFDQTNSDGNADKNFNK